RIVVYADTAAIALEPAWLDVDTLGALEGHGADDDWIGGPRRRAKESADACGYGVLLVRVVGVDRRDADIQGADRHAGDGETRQVWKYRPGREESIGNTD